MAMMREEAVVLRETAPMNILIVDDEPTIREACGEVAQLTGMNATMVATAEEAIEILENTAVDIVLTDLMLPHTSGLELLKRVHDTHPNLPVIVLTQYGTIDSAVAATRMGAIDYVTKPFRIEELRARLERASRAVELQQENQLLREQLRTRPGFGGLIGRIRENAASVQDDSEGQPARVSGADSGRERHGKRIGGEAACTIPGRARTVHSCRWIVRRWCPR